MKEGDAARHHGRRCRRGWGDMDHQSQETQGDTFEWETWGDEHDPLDKTWLTPTLAGVTSSVFPTVSHGNARSPSQFSYFLPALKS